MRSLGQNPTEQELQNIVNEIDLDGNGTIDFIEFSIMMTKYVKAIDTEEELRLAFRVFDKDANGMVDVNEIRQILINLDILSLDEITEMVEICDGDGDGRINYTGFKNLFLLCKAFYLNLNYKRVFSNDEFKSKINEINRRR